MQLKGQTTEIMGVLFFVLIGVAVALPIIKGQVNDATLLQRITNEVLTFNTLSNVSLSQEDIVVDSETLLNASNVAQSFARNTDYTLSPGNSVTLGSITWLQNYTTNSTNSSAATSTSQVAYVSTEAKNATFVAKNHTLRVVIFNATTGSATGSATIIFNGVTISQVPLPAAGAQETHVFNNISGSSFKAGSRPNITVSGAASTLFSVNVTSVVQNNGERVLASYDYKPPAYIENAGARTMMTIIIILLILFIVMVVAKQFGLI